MIVTETAPATSTGLGLLRSNLGKKNIPSLDGLRAVSVTLVVLLHRGVPFVPNVHGVLTFFVLSGFLITWLLLNESEETGSVSVKNFYIRRALRIFPAFYVFWFVSLGFHLLTRGSLNHAGWVDYLMSFLYLSDYRHTPTHMHPLLGHTWSLSVEEQFYLIWPLTFLLFRRDLRKLTWILVALIGAVYVYRNILFFGFHVGEGHLHFAFDSRADHLFIGCLLAVLLKRGVLDDFWNAVVSKPWTPGITLALLIGSIALGFRLGYPYKYAVGFSLDAILIAIFLVQVVALGASTLWSWLNWSSIRFIGRISYPLYLYHTFGTEVGQYVLRGFQMRVTVPAEIVLSLLMAGTSYFVVERPFLRLKSRMRRMEAPCTLNTPEGTTKLLLRFERR